MNILSIEIFSRIAHFRKVFSNSTSLSYYFPPRTTIMGITAAALGRDRDSYYDELDKLNYAIETLTPLRKLIFGENYLDTDQVSFDRFRGRSNRVTITKELIVSAKGDFLGYRIYMTYNKEIEEMFKYPKYPLSLGQSEMLAWVEKVEELDCEEERDFSGKSVYGAIPASFSIEPATVITLEYGMPRKYESGRMSGRLCDYIFPTEPSPVRIVKGSGNGIKCKEKNLVYL